MSNESNIELVWQCAESIEDETGKRPTVDQIVDMAAELEIGNKWDRVSYARRWLTFINKLKPKRKER